MENIGRTIKLNRTWKGLSSSELAEKANISLSYLSKIESNKVNPSIRKLDAIANALDMNVDDLFQAGSQDPRHVSDPPKLNLRPKVVRANERKTMSPPGSSVIYELLSPDLQRNLQFIYVRHVPNEPELVFSHRGEECIYCVRGQLQMTIGGEVFILAAGDCISFDSSIPHTATAYGNEPVEIISAQTPPSF